MYLATKDGISETPRLRPIKALFCKHRHIIAGKACSKNGLRRISGLDVYVVCIDCGKVLLENHTNY